MDGEWERTNEPLTPEQSLTAPFGGSFAAPYLPGSLPAEARSPEMWLRRRFELLPFDVSGSVILNFNGISGAYSAYLNGVPLFSGAGPHPNHVEVTPFVRAGENVLTVYSASRPFSEGLTGSVWLEFAAKSFFSFLRPTAVYRDKAVYLRGMIRGSTEGLRVVVEVAFDGRAILKKIYRAEPDFTLHVPLGRLPDMWSEGRGKIYDIRVTLLFPDGAVADRVYTYTAFKEFSVLKGETYINGRKCFFKCLSDPMYYPATIKKKRSEIFSEGVAKAEALGFNTIFFREYPSPTELYILDKFGMHAIVSLPHIVTEDQSYRSLIMRDFGHPCIAIWNPEPDNYDADTARRIYSGIKAADPLHPVMFAKFKELYCADIYTFTAPAEEIPLYLSMRFNGGKFSEKEELRFIRSHPGLMKAEELGALPAFFYPAEGVASGNKGRASGKGLRPKADPPETTTGLQGYLSEPLYDSPGGEGLLTFSREFKNPVAISKPGRPH